MIFNATRSRRRGQGLVEYVIVVGLIAILMIGALKALRVVLQRTYGKVSDQIEDVATDIELGGSGDVAAGPTGSSGPIDPSLPAHLRTALEARRCPHTFTDAARRVNPETKVCGNCKRTL